MKCTICGSPSQSDFLCDPHQRSLATQADFTPEQLIARPPSKRVFWLVDMFGCAHPMPAQAKLGRSATNSDLSVLHPSVSSEHAQIALDGDKLTIEDLTSLNGTFWNEKDVTTLRTTSHNGVLRVGSIRFMFCVLLGETNQGEVVYGTVPQSERAYPIEVVFSSMRWQLWILTNTTSLVREDQEVALSALEGQAAARLVVEQRKEQIHQQRRIGSKDKLWCPRC